MTAQTVAKTARAKWPEKNLPDIASVLLGDVDDDVREAFLAAMKAADATAHRCDCYDPMGKLVETWWPQAMFWADPVRARQILADVEDIQKNGLPPERRGRTSAEVKAAWEARHGQKLGPSWDKLASRG